MTKDNASSNVVPDSAYIGTHETLLSHVWRVSSPSSLYNAGGILINHGDDLRDLSLPDSTSLPSSKALSLTPIESDLDASHYPNGADRLVMIITHDFSPRHSSFSSSTDGSSSNSISVGPYGPRISILECIIPRIPFNEPSSPLSTDRVRPPAPVYEERERHMSLWLSSPSLLASRAAKSLLSSSIMMARTKEVKNQLKLTVRTCLVAGYMQLLKTTLPDYGHYLLNEYDPSSSSFGSDDDDDKSGNHLLLTGPFGSSNDHVSVGMEADRRAGIPLPKDTYTLYYINRYTLAARPLLHQFYNYQMVELVSKESIGWWFRYTFYPKEPTMAELAKHKAMKEAALLSSLLSKSIKSPPPPPPSLQCFVGLPSVSHFPAPHFCLLHIVTMTYFPTLHPLAG
jgi:hypothetical protein